MAADVRRVAERLSSLSQARLTGAVPGFASCADAARRTAQVLADAAAGLEAGQHAPSWREVPLLGDFSVADQVAVTGHDAAAALGRAAPTDPAWTREGPADAGRVLADARGALAELRRLL
ncbi:MAG: hypothetical protein QOI54_1508 [Actinomycetota bacterium]|nr:hypothetical protein [Actinomycetota bacterium]